MTTKSKSFYDRLKEVVTKKYKEKWLVKTVVTFVISLLNIIIVAMLTFYINFSVDIVEERIFEILKSGSFYIISISLISNIIKDKKNIALENKYFIKILYLLAIVFGGIIAMFYGASYQVNQDKIELVNYQIIVSLILYILIFLIIGCFNFLNRTDDIENAVTNGDEESLILDSKSSSNNTEGLKL